MYSTFRLVKNGESQSKTIVRNRKFIIAVSLILRSNLDDLKEMVTHTERRQQYE